MQDLNDLYYFVQVVDHGGFAPAARALDIPKSKLSRRVATLEARLDVRLLQRSTRHFTVTELGQAYYARCKAMLLEAEAAATVIDAARAEPCGTVQVAVPITLLHSQVGTMLTTYAAAHPQVRLQVVAVDRPVDVLAEGFDLAIRVRPPPLEDSDLALRVFAHAAQCLVASPALIEHAGLPATPAELAAWPSLAHGVARARYVWKLTAADGTEVEQAHTPRFVATDLLTLRTAALAGLGIAQLPRMIVREPLAAGTLVRLLPDFEPRAELVHAVFPSRRGLNPAVRALIDHLASAFASLGDD